MKATHHFFVAAILLLLLTTPAMGGEYVVMTSPNPPFSITKGLHINGISVDTIEVIMQMTDTPFDRKEIKLMPWKKASARARSAPNQILLSVPRTMDIENDFKWVGPVYFPRIVLIGKKGRDFAISSVADASKYRIGVVRGGPAMKALLAQGLETKALKQSTAFVQPLLQLKSGSIDLIAHSDIAATYAMQRMGMDKDDYTIVYALKKVPLYFAFNKETDDATIKRFNDALASYKTPMSEWRSVFDRNVGKYLPYGVIE